MTETLEGSVSAQQDNGRDRRLGTLPLYSCFQRGFHVRESETGEQISLSHLYEPIKPARTLMLKNIYFTEEQLEETCPYVSTRDPAQQWKPLAVITSP